MCKRDETVIVNGYPTDRCIAPVMKALSGLTVGGCCCGHGNIMGYICLKDGRYLGVFPDRKAILKVRHDKLDN